MKKIKHMMVVLVIAGLSQWVIAATEMHCDICGMIIPDKAKNHIVLKKENDKNAKVYHVCSKICLVTAKKNNPDHKKIEMVDFNHPEKFINGEKAFVLKGSEKIKADIGEMAMAPYLGAFSTKKEAEAAQKKYGDGHVVEGVENALKK